VSREVDRLVSVGLIRVSLDADNDLSNLAIEFVDLLGKLVDCYSEEGRAIEEIENHLFELTTQALKDQIAAEKLKEGKRGQKVKEKKEEIEQREEEST